MRVYLDNCCYNRPFDDQSQLKIRLESEAKLHVQSLMRAGVVEYAWSSVLNHEIGRSPYLEQNLTTDGGILRRMRSLGEMRVANPVEFVMEEPI